MQGQTNFHGKKLFFKVDTILQANQNSLKLKEKGKKKWPFIDIEIMTLAFGMFDMTSPFHDYRPGALMYAHQHSK